MRKQDVEKWSFGIIGIRKEIQIKNRVNRIKKNATYKRVRVEKSFKEQKEIRISKKIHDIQNYRTKQKQVAEDSAMAVQRREMKYQVNTQENKRAL